MSDNSQDYSRGIAAKPQPLTLEQAAKITPPMQLIDTEGLIDVPRMRGYRLGRVREQLRLHNYGAAVLTDPLSIRYATGVRNCTLFQTHIQAGYLFVPAEGPVVWFDTEPGRLTGRQLETIDEIRDEILPLAFMFAGDGMVKWAQEWAGQMAELLKKHVPDNLTLAVERIGLEAVSALQAHDITVKDASSVLAMARKIKSPEEILCMNQVIAVAEDGMARMQRNLRAGLQEIELWSHMWQANIEGGGEWIEYRLLSSGERTNPWQQEASSRMIRPGDLVCFDCGMIGPWGYGADISRGIYCPPGKPSDYQKKLYTQSYLEITHNKDLLCAGASFREVIDKRYIQPGNFGDQPYPVLAHGLGMGDEWPVLYYPCDEKFHFDGVLESGMVICVESYVGEKNGDEGVKLEDMVLVTESGPIVLSRYPFDEDLLAL